MKPRVRIDECQVLTLLRCDIKPAERRAKEVPARVGLSSQSCFDARKRLTEAIHCERILRGIRRVLERAQECFKLICIQVEADEWPMRL